MSWLAELRQRKVFRVAAAYAVVAWLLVQVASVVVPALKLPEWTVTFTTVLLILGFPVALLLAWSFDVVRARSAAAAPATVSTPPLHARSVVVLPFVNMTDDAAQTHFADGIVEDLTTRLQAIAGLKVHSRQSAFAYQGRPADARTISRELGCRYVVEGSVRKIGERMRVTAQLIDAPADEHVWAERYDRKLEDAFALQDEICDQIVAAIEARLAPETARDRADAVAAPSPTGTVPLSPSRGQAFARAVLGARWIVPGALALLAMAGLLTWTLQQRSRERWAREEALPELQALVAKDDYARAFDLAGRIQKVVPNDPVLKALEPSYADRISLATRPAGAQVSYRPYTSAEAAWRLVGETPLERRLLPMGVGIWKFEHPGRTTALLVMRNPGLQLGNFADPAVIAEAADTDLSVELADAKTAPPDMVLVPATKLPVPQVSDYDSVDLPAFYIDRFEVTNRAYKEFIDAGGYTDVSYWRDLPASADIASFTKALARFVDSTGRPGPAGWEAGSYPDGAADYPVAGVSWYEAAAYARFRSKELPTAYHWYRAAYSLNEVLESLASAIVASSNFSGRGPARVGQYSSIGPFGTYDMAGNVREWLWNDTGQGRWVAGGGWNEPPYMYNQPDAADPNDRAIANGFRCMRAADGQPAREELRKALPQKSIDFAALTPVADDVYALLVQQLEYSSARLDPRVEPQRSGDPHWTRELITLATGYDDTRFAIALFLPAGVSPPYQTILFGPHAGYFMGIDRIDTFDPASTAVPIDFILKSGRALAVVALDGTFDRSWSPARRQATTSTDRYRIILRHARQDYGRAIDYLATRQDIDLDRLGYLGVSWGAQSLMPTLAVEKRIGAAVIVGGGVFLLDLPDAEQPYNYLPRVTQPVLMLNGRWDIDVNLAAQQRQLELLGTPPDRKQRLLFEAGHGALPQNQLVRASLDWYDKYLGPTTQRQ